MLLASLGKAILCSALLATIGLAAPQRSKRPAQTQHDTSIPIKETGLIKALKVNGFSSAELAERIRQRGVDFVVTGEVEQELTAAGATLAIIEACRENYNPPGLDRQRGWDHVAHGDSEDYYCKSDYSIGSPLERHTILIKAVPTAGAALSGDLKHVTHVLLELECDCGAASIKVLSFRTYGVHGLVPSLSGDKLNWLDIAPPSVGPSILRFACRDYVATGETAKRKGNNEDPNKVAVSGPIPETEVNESAPGDKLPEGVHVEANWTFVTQSDASYYYYLLRSLESLPDGKKRAWIKEVSRPGHQETTRSGQAVVKTLTLELFDCRNRKMMFDRYFSLDSAGARVPGDPPGPSTWYSMPRGTFGGNVLDFVCSLPPMR